MSYLFTTARASLTLHTRTARVNDLPTIYATMTIRRSARISSRGNGVQAPSISQTTTSQKRKPSPEPPSTPAKKRIRPVEPVTPTPTAVGLITENGDHKLGKKPRNATVTRLADPNLSNATLLSPETSRVVASRNIEFVSPSKASSVRTTTANLLEEACAHLIKVDERMRPLIEKHHCRVFSPEGLAEKIDPFESLTSGIISQQVSGAAAKSIKAKFVALFHKDGEEAEKRFPLPSEVAACSVEHLRTAGLSQRKAEYIQGLAEKFANGDLNAQLLHDAPYEEVLEKLIAVRGLGRWSVEMFACFALKRMDVFSLGDLGVQRGMAAFVGRDVAKLKSKGGKWKYMSEKEMSELSEQFAPYRSLFMWYMWRVEETDISTLE
uniref:HhH-GPD domain-containing protein n=1 Tax=Bionectria ochroleuca TaxID=29856 RepID=A0A8H7NFX8_BIOOC